MDPRPPAPAPSSPDVRREAERLAAEIVAQGVSIRIMGGLAVWLRCETARRPPFARDYRDIDLVAPARARKAVSAFLEAAGYLPDRLFNALHGAQRLVYTSTAGAWSLDVVFDELNMSHRIDLRARLDLPGATLDLADLLMTKLQVWQVNEKDLGDAACLLADHRLVDDARALPDERDRGGTGGEGRNGGGRDGRGDGSGEGSGSGGIDLRRILALVTADWGLCHTTERNLARVREDWARRPAEGAPYDVGRQVDRLLDEIARAPKSLGWKARARVGERVRWYEVPEEVRK